VLTQASHDLSCLGLPAGILVSRAQVRRSATLHAQGSPPNQTRAPPTRCSDTEEARPWLAGFSLFIDSRARPPELASNAQRQRSREPRLVGAVAAVQCTQLIVGPKVSKNVVLPQATLRIPIVLLPCAQIRWVWALHSAFLLFRLYEFFFLFSNNLLVISGVVLVKLQMPGESSFQHYPAISDISRCLQ
jgi:hypothetical protein